MKTAESKKIRMVDNDAKQHTEIFSKSRIILTFHSGVQNFIFIVPLH